MTKLHNISIHRSENFAAAIGFLVSEGLPFEYQGVKDGVNVLRMEEEVWDHFTLHFSEWDITKVSGPATTEVTA
jgi:hypothetical protein